MRSFDKTQDLKSQFNKTQAIRSMDTRTYNNIMGPVIKHKFGDTIDN